MTTFITTLDAAGDGPRVAVKDIIDVKGVPTTAGCRAIERTARPAVADAACLAGARAAGARLVGKANLHELAMLPLGTNPWFGTPVNPSAPELIPGGSSSGCAVAVATGEADVAFGSDTGGSIRVPSACCGTVGLKTTAGRVPLGGVWPLAPSLDTVGPMAATVDGVVLGMELLEPGFRRHDVPAQVVGRLRTSGHPDIEAAVDAALHAAGFDVVALGWSAFDAARQAFLGIYFSEIWDTHHDLVAGHPESIGPDIAQAMALADGVRLDGDEARRAGVEVRRSLHELFGRVELLALPTLPVFPPRPDAVTAETLFDVCVGLTANVAPFNVAGVPCTAQPVPVPSHALPASLQLVGPMGGEELLLATAARVEAAVAAAGA